MEAEWNGQFPLDGHNEARVPMGEVLLLASSATRWRPSKIRHEAYGHTNAFTELEAVTRCGTHGVRRSVRRSRDLQLLEAVPPRFACGLRILRCENERHRQRHPGSGLWCLAARLCDRDLADATMGAARWLRLCGIRDH